MGGSKSDLAYSRSIKPFPSMSLLPLITTYTFNILRRSQLSHPLSISETQKWGGQPHLSLRQQFSTMTTDEIPSDKTYLLVCIDSTLADVSKYKVQMQQDHSVVYVNNLASKVRDVLNRTCGKPHVFIESVHL